jgi:hypothetical protein
MHKFQYTTQRLLITDSDILNEMGAMYWELVQIVGDVAIFKRPIISDREILDALRSA